MESLPIIYKLAARYNIRYPQYDYWHFVSAGWIGYSNAVRLYDGDKSSLSNWVHLKVGLAMRDAARNEIENYRDGNHRIFVKKYQLNENFTDLKIRVDDIYQKNCIAVSIDKLTPREREIILHYYYLGRTHKQIGARYGVNEHRISQLKKEALRRLKGHLIRKKITGGQ
jgi:RNA polymerase sigma factor (sigma-70 family)